MRNSVAIGVTDDRSWSRSACGRDRPRFCVREAPRGRVVGDDAVRPEAADVERHCATDLRVQSGRHHPGRDPIGRCDRVPHLFRSGGHLIGALHPMFDTVGLVGVGHEGSLGRGYDETVRRCGRPSSWWYRATSAATADCRSVANAARSSGDLNPITVSTVRVGRTRSRRRAAGDRPYLGHSPSVHGDQIRSRETIGDLVRIDGRALQHVGSNNEMARRTTDESFGDTAPHALLGQLDQPMGLQRLQVVVHLLTGRPDRRRNRGSRPRFGQRVEDRGPDRIERHFHGGSVSEHSNVVHEPQGTP